jgi:NAD+ diphosphatase
MRAGDAFAQRVAFHFRTTLVIMLIVSGDDVLVGRSPGWPGMYSLLAG